MASVPSTTRPKVLIEDWGLISYKEAWERQKAYVEAALSHPEAWRDRLILCEHPPVITLGRNAHPENLLFSPALLKAQGVEVYEVERGGDVTYHGPGQIVGYPILWLERYRRDISWYMRSLEEVIIQAIGWWGLKGERIAGHTGVWLLSPPRKIAAMGVKLSRWVCMHGFALNVNTDLRGFGLIVPCGIRDKGVTSMAQELGYPVPLSDVKSALIEAFARILNVETG